MHLEKNNEKLNNLIGMHYKYALLLKKLFEENNITNCLELGFGYGKSSCYIASILKDLGGGHLTTIDLRKAKNNKPNINQLLKELDLEDYVTCYFERQSYNWRLMKLIEDNPQPIYDFCFIDGGHNWYNDGYAFFLVDKLLKPGGLLIFEALNWTYNSSSMNSSSFVQAMDEDERETPHIKKVYELLVKTHPLYEKFEVVDNRIAIAYKKQNKNVNNLMETQLQDTSDFLKTYHYTQLNNKIKELTNKFSTMEKDYVQFKQSTDNCLDSENFLFNTLFIDYKLEPKRLLNNLQSLETQLLLFISNICEKYNLEWWLDSGNLLGAARHEYFIPWDDDVDISMMRSDYHKLNEVLPKEIKNANLTDCIDIVYRYRKYRGKAINSFIQVFIKDKNLGKKVIVGGIDIFPFDYLTNYDNMANFGKLYEKAKKNFYTHLTAGNDRTQIYMGLNQEEVMNEYFSLLNLTYEKQKYIIPGVEGSFGYNGTNLMELIILDTDKMFPLSKIKFGDYEFPCPKELDEYLKTVFGEYMTIPKSIRTHGRVNQFRQIENANEMFEEYISRLNAVNNGFK